MDSTESSESTKPLEKADKKVLLKNAVNHF